MISTSTIKVLILNDNLFISMCKLESYGFASQF